MLSLLLCMAVTVPALAPPPMSRQPIAELIAALGHDYYEERESAQRLLEERIIEAEPLIRSMLKSTADLEQRRRLERLCALINRAYYQKAVATFDSTWRPEQVPWISALWHDPITGHDVSVYASGRQARLRLGLEDRYLNGCWRDRDARDKRLYAPWRNATRLFAIDLLAAGVSTRAVGILFVEMHRRDALWQQRLRLQAQANAKGISVKLLVVGLGGPFWVRVR